MAINSAISRRVTGNTNFCLLYTWSEKYKIMLATFPLICNCALLKRLEITSSAITPIRFITFNAKSPLVFTR